MRTLTLLLTLTACTVPEGKDDTGDPDTGADGGEAGGGSGGGTSGDEGEPDCDVVTFGFAGQIVTVSGTPLGLDIPLDTPISGTLGYKPCLNDIDEFDGFGEYRHSGSSQFEARFLDTVLTGSGDATVEVVHSGSTWRFVDGYEHIPDDDFGPRVMQVDGADAPRVELWISTGPADDIFTSEDIPAPDWLDPEAPHTFSISDDGGTALTQWTVFEVR